MTDTICIFSDEPAVLLHEGIHAKDFSERALRGRDVDWYAIGRLLPPVALSQESTASDEAINYLRKKKDRKEELKSYRVLYPAFGTYVGGYSGIPYGNVIGAMIGQVSGFWTQHEKRVSYAAIDGARRGREIIKDFNSDPVANTLIKQDAERRAILNKAFLK